MKREVHIAALRAASKVAFSVAFLAGCSAQSPDDASHEGDQGPAQESDVTSKSAAKKFSCDDIVVAAFGTKPSPFGGPKLANPSAAVKTCCRETLSKGYIESGPYRQDCCNNTTLAANDPDTAKINTACSPWGPPVPPAMKARRVDAPLLTEVA